MEVTCPTLVIIVLCVYASNFLCLQERYNTVLTKTRVTVGRVIGQIKRRFHCLHSELRLEPERAGRVIVACVVLFNMSKDLGVLMDEEDEDHEMVEERRGAEDPPSDGNIVRDMVVANFFYIDQTRQVN